MTDFKRDALRYLLEAWMSAAYPDDEKALFAALLALIGAKEEERVVYVPHVVPQYIPQLTPQPLHWWNGTYCTSIDPVAFPTTSDGTLVCANDSPYALGLSPTHLR